MHKFTVKHKFNPGDTVWTNAWTKPCKVKINYILVQKSKYDFVFEYSVMDYPLKYGAIFTIGEENLFKTKKQCKMRKKDQ